MITFIMPTMWKPGREVAELISDYKSAEIPNSEFIVIDNSHGGYLEPEVTMYIPKENLFVNKSWNIGVQMARTDLICLINDDIRINFVTLKNNLQRISEMDFGIIGFDANKNLNGIRNAPNEKYIFEEAECRTLGFGCMMIMKKENYIHIDERMKIFFGDDLLYWWNRDKNGRKIYTISNLGANGELSMTSNDYNDELQNELPFFEEEIKRLQNV